MVKIVIPPEDRKFDITALNEPLQRKEMEWLVGKRQGIWGRYAHTSVAELSEHIETHPDTLYIAHLLSSGEIGGFLETYNLVTEGDPARLPPRAD